MSGEEFFDVRKVNVIKLASFADCQIIEAECDFTISEIDRQVKTRIGDSSWREAALDARDAALHKKSLVQIKRAQLEERQAALKASDEHAFKARFYRAAQNMLDAEQFLAISAASSKKD